MKIIGIDIVTTTILSDMSGLPLTVEQNEEEAALGAAISAFTMIASISLEQWLNGRHN